MSSQKHSIATYFLSRPLSNWISFWLASLIALLVLFGCQRPQPGPIAVVTPTYTPTIDPAEQSQVNPTIESVLTAQAPETATPQPSLTPTITTTPTCSIPETWLAYTVQPGDTLFAIANITGTTIVAIKGTNCKLTDDLSIGEILYLPSMPPARQQTIPVTPNTIILPTQTICSPFDGCPTPDSELASMKLPQGGPNDPTFVPCPPPQPGFPVQILSVPPESEEHEIGDRAYFFACKFTAPSLINAHIVGPNNYFQELIVRTEIPNPDLQMGGAQRVIQWDPICDLELGVYTVTLNDQQGTTASFSFNLVAPSYEKILTIPQAAAPGTEFDVYFCGYDEVAGTSIQADLFYEKMIEEDGDYILDPSTSFVVDITEEGWGKLSIPSFDSDIPQAYSWEDNDQILKGEDLFWLRDP